MTAVAARATLLITVTGQDRPGVTGVLFTALASRRVEVLDVEQVVVRGALTLGVLVATAGDPEAVQESVEQAMASVRMTVRVSIAGPDGPAGQSRIPTHMVVVLGRPLRAKAIAVLARRFGRAGVNIETIRRVADHPVTGLELGVRTDDDDALRALVAEIAAKASVDIAVERAGLGRRAKRLIVFDVDSTLITGEVIEMLAERAGQRAEVARVTTLAMRGDLDFEKALRARVALLAGLDAAVLDEVGAALRLTPGARTTIRTLHRLGYRCGIVSGGFTQVTRYLVDSLGLDFSDANTLEVIDGRLTGRLVGPVVDRAGKARALQRFAAQFEVPMSQTVAVGDGANDIDMLSAAGLGIAFNAKPTVAEHADTSLNQPFLDPVLFILGITRDEVEAADAADAAHATAADDDPPGSRVGPAAGDRAEVAVDAPDAAGAVDAPDAAGSGPAAAVPTGAALAAVRARYAAWLGLDTAQVLADRDEDPARIRALQIVLRMERDRPPRWPAALALAAQGCAALCLDPRSEPGGEWFDAVRDYCAGHIRKVTRRARAAHWEAVTDLPGIGLVDGDTEIRVLVPGLASELDKRVSRLQVGGTDTPREPVTDTAADPAESETSLRIWLNPVVPMTLGKAVAQAGHAGMIAAALLAGTDRAALTDWAERGLPVRSVDATSEEWDLMVREVADPVTAWRDRGLLAVRDAGFTEIDPGTVTVIAHAPRSS